MFKSFSDSLRSFWHPKTNETEPISERKRKRPAVETYEDDSDVEIISVKKPRQESNPGFFSFITTPMSKMSEWVRKKTVSQDHFFVRPIPAGGRWGRDQDGAGDRPRERLPVGSRHHRQPSGNRQPPTATGGSFTSNNGTHSFMERRDGERLSRPPLHGRNGIPENSVNGDMHTTDSMPVSLSSSRQSSCSSSRLGLGRRTTADQCFQLKEREQYLKLLQQHTTVDLGYHINKKKASQQRQDIIQRQPRSVIPPSLFSDLPVTTATLNSAELSSSFARARSQTTDSQSATRYRVTPSSFTKIPPLSFARTSSLAERHPDGPEVFRTTSPSERSSSGSFAKPLPVGRMDQQHRPGAPRRSSLSDSKRAASPKVPTRDDECVVILDDDEEEERKETKPSRPDFITSEYLDEEWLGRIKYEPSEKVRQEEIRELEMTKKLYEERREDRLCTLDKRLKQQMRLFDAEPEVIEEIPIPEVPQEKPLPELTDRMQREINNALDGGRADEVLSDAFRLKITRGDIATLRGLNWLNDEVINFYMNLLMERGGQEGFEKTYCFNTFFYPKLIAGGHAAVRRWTRTVDIFAHSYLVIPVHLGVHWCVCVVLVKDKKICYFDSMGGNNNQCLNSVRQYLYDESVQKRNVQLDLSQWTTECAKDIPLQMNGSDCGMFSCMYAETLTRGAQITFTQKDMPYFRRRMVYEILKKKIL